MLVTNQNNMDDTNTNPAVDPVIEEETEETAEMPEDESVVEETDESAE